jgi:hypothetical protein
MPLGLAAETGAAVGLTVGVGSGIAVELGFADEAHAESKAQIIKSIDVNA